jgi:hypothetical protein
VSATPNRKTQAHASAKEREREREGLKRFAFPANRTHLANIEPDHKRGFWVLGGAYMAEPPVEGSTPRMLGSAMLAVADSKEEVLEKIRNDVYATSGVWDVDKVQIWPFRSAIRSGM